MISGKRLHLGAKKTRLSQPTRLPAPKHVRSSVPGIQELGAAEVRHQMLPVAARMLTLLGPPMRDRAPWRIGGSALLLLPRLSRKPTVVCLLLGVSPRPSLEKQIV